MTPRSRLRRTLGTGLLASGLILVAGCQTTASVATRAPAASACRVFKPIAWSVTDSVPTQKQAIEHNAAWKSLCAGKSYVR